MSGGRPICGSLFQEWETSLARSAVSRFQARYPWLKIPDGDDLLQECLIQWYLTRDRFDGEQGASLSTYMSRVVDKRLQTILREQFYSNRRINQFAGSLERQLKESGDTLVSLVPSRETEVDIALALDVRSALNELTSSQRDICALLSQGYPVLTIAVALGRPRTTVRRQIKKIREVFLRRGLDNY